MALRTISVQLEEDLLARVDEAAGDVPRQRWIARALETMLGLEGDGVRMMSAATTADAEPARGRGPTIEPARAPRKKSASAAPREDASPAAARRAASSETEQAPAPRARTRARAMVKQPRPIVPKRGKR